jgi:hypothetical protein
VKLKEGYKWNYSPLIENYYPKDYLNEEIMWDMTKANYASDVYYKGYPWHYDNNLPGLEHIYDKSDNLMAFPLFKGFGYKMDYSPENTVPNRYCGGKGWWSDNLQNKDNTLLAGQDHSNYYPTINDTLLTENDWINAKDIKSEEIHKKLNNIYVCQFNQHRIKIHPRTNTQLVTSHNIYQNNIIPIYPDLNDSDYKHYNCTNVYQYSPTNISLVDNRVKTNSDRDWLYFSLNLRAEAKETLNIILNLTPFSDRLYEGETKINDGGRFTYWNPALTKNGYIYLDNNVNVVNSFRVDLTADVIIYPSSVNTFKAINYHLFSLEDKNEKLREYKLTTYTNSYGFGDAVTMINIGGIKDSDCRIKPGETTYIKITIFNNAGFDWNMKGGAITAEKLAYIDPNTLMKEKIHAVRVPKAYNFLELEIPEPIRDFIDIIPSDHNQNVSAQFFDFECINLVTIRDGFKAEYYYKLTLKDGLDEKYFGRFWEIKVNLKYDYFDVLPGAINDPVTKVKSGVTMVHDYILKIPSIKFGIPYSSNYPIPEYRNKVFYTIGRATDIKISYNIHEEFSLDDIKIVSLEEVDKLKEAMTNQENYNEQLLNIWNEGIANKSSYLTGEIDAKVLEPNDGYKRIWIYLNKSFPELPYEVYGEPDVNKIYILVKVSAPQVTYGSRLNVKWGYGEYNDSRTIRKTNTGLAATINAYGPWMKINIENTFLKYNKSLSNFTIAENQTYFASNGYMKLKITAINSGSRDAFQTSYKYVFSKYANILNNYGDVLDKKEIIRLVKNETSGDTILYLNSNRQIPQNTKDAYNIYLKYDFNKGGIGRRYLEENNDLVILKSADVTLCQNAQCNDDDSFVNQFININYKMPMNKMVYTDMEDEDEEPIEETKSKSKSKSWIIGIVVACVITAIIIYLLLDYKLKLFIFKNKENYTEEKPENNEKIDIKDSTQTYRVRKRSIRNSQINFTSENKIDN